MAKRDKIYLKTYFETGDKPTEEQFGEFIDSTVNTEQTSSQYISSSLVVQGNITANTFIVTQSVIVSQTGSTAFGNSIDDKHHFTGSLLASGSVRITGSFVVNSGSSNLMIDSVGSVSGSITSTGSFGKISIDTLTADSGTFGYLQADEVSSSIVRLGGGGNNDGELYFGSASSKIYSQQDGTDLFISSSDDLHFLSDETRFKQFGDGNIIFQSGSTAGSETFKFNVKGKGSLITSGSITASGDIKATHISASGYGVFGSSVNIAKHLTSSGTASIGGDMSASGNLKGQNLFYKGLDTSEDASHYISFKKNGANFASNITNGFTFNPSSDTIMLGGLVQIKGQAQEITSSINIHTRHVTASGNIVVTGSQTKAINLDSSGHITMSGNIRSTGGGANFNGGIYMTAGISGSGNFTGAAGTGSFAFVSASQVYSTGNVSASATGSFGRVEAHAVGGLSPLRIDGNVTMSEDLAISGSTIILGNITASGEISGSGTGFNLKGLSTGSFDYIQTEIIEGKSPLTIRGDVTMSSNPNVNYLFVSGGIVMQSPAGGLAAANNLQINRTTKNQLVFYNHYGLDHNYRFIFESKGASGLSQFPGYFYTSGSGRYGLKIGGGSAVEALPLNDGVTVAGIVTASGNIISEDQVLGANYRTLWVPAGSMIPTETNGAQALTEELATNDVMIDSFAFDKDTDEFVNFNIVMPEQWNAGSFKAKFYYKTGVTSGTAMFGIAAQSYNDDDPLDAAFTIPTTHSVDTVKGTADDLAITDPTIAFTASGAPAAGHLLQFQVMRDVSADNANGDVELIGVLLQYQETNSGSGAWG